VILKDVRVPPETAPQASILIKVSSLRPAPPRRALHEGDEVMRSQFDLPSIPEPQPIEPFNGPVRDHRAGALLHALGGPAAVAKAAKVEGDDWDPSADEDMGGFDIHLGVYASD
jgi:hypothetical protein